MHSVARQSLAVVSVVQKLVLHCTGSMHFRLLGRRILPSLAVNRNFLPLSDPFAVILPPVSVEPDIRLQDTCLGSLLQRVN